MNTIASENICPSQTLLHYRAPNRIANAETFATGNNNNNNSNHRNNKQHNVGDYDEIEVHGLEASEF